MLIPVGHQSEQSLRDKLYFSLDCSAKCLVLCIPILKDDMIVLRESISPPNTNLIKEKKKKTTDATHHDRHQLANSNNPPLSRPQYPHLPLPPHRRLPSDLLLSHYPPQLTQALCTSQECHSRPSGHPRLPCSRGDLHFTRRESHFPDLGSVLFRSSECCIMGRSEGFEGGVGDYTWGGGGGCW